MCRSSLPRSAQQFEREWAALRKEPLAAQRRFLARLPAAEYATVFRESLAEPTLVSLLECLDACTTPPPADAEEVGVVMQLVLQVLGGLASTRRFELLLMFLDKPRLACVARLFGALRASGASTGADGREPKMLRDRFASILRSDPGWWSARC